MSRKFAVRRMKYQGSFMVNICDEELVGRKVREGELEIDITRSYFAQEMLGEEDTIALLRSCSIANLVGRRIVEKALDLKLASNMSVRKISGVPFLMIYRFHHAY